MKSLWQWLKLAILSHELGLVASRKQGWSRREFRYPDDGDSRDGPGYCSDLNVLGFPDVFPDLTASYPVIRLATQPAA